MSILAGIGSGAAAHLEKRQCQLDEPEYGQECLTVVLPALATVTVTVTVTVKMTLAEAMTVTVAVVAFVAETLTIVSLGEARVKPAEQALLGMMPVKVLVTALVLAWRLSMWAGTELGTGWGYSTEEALAGLGGGGGFVKVVKGFVTAVKR